MSSGELKLELCITECMNGCQVRIGLWSSVNLFVSDVTEVRRSDVRVAGLRLLVLVVECVLTR